MLAQYKKRHMTLPEMLMALFPWSDEAETTYAEVVSPEIVDTSLDDVILPPNALPTVCNVDGDLLADKFCNISMTKMSKLFLTATWFMVDAEKDELLGRPKYSSYQDWMETCAPTFPICWEHCVWSFAVMITKSMQMYYREESDLTVDLDVLRAKQISYPNSGTLCTVGELMDGPGNAYAFLLKLTGEKGSKIESVRSSPFFSFWAPGDTRSTRQALNNMVVDIILPYAVTLPLILMLSAVTNRPDCEKNGATQYLLEPLVFNCSTWQSTPLLQMIQQVPNFRSAKQRRATQSPYDASREHMLKFTPYSPFPAARSLSLIHI